MKKKYISIICVFLVLVFVPSGITVITKDKDFSVKENRALATKPELTFDSLMNGDFQSEYENYLSDQFFLRDKWVSAKTAAMKTIGKKDINSVYLGKDNYLIEKHSSKDFDEENIEDNTQILTAFLNDMSEYGFDSVSCVFVPSKSEVLNNKLPTNAIAYDTDYIVDGVKKNLENVNFIYLNNELSKHKDEYIYYKSDHHWTSLGSYYGYNEYMKSISRKPITLDSMDKKVVSKDFKGTDYDKLQLNTCVDEIERYSLKGVKVNVEYIDEETSNDSIYFDEMLKKKDKYAYFLNGNFSQVNISTSNNTNKTLLLIKDSYANSMIQFLINDYDNIIMIDPRYYTGSIYDVIDAEDNITDVLVMYNTEKFANDTHQNILEQTEEDDLFEE